jgi:hypothetical protein
MRQKLSFAFQGEACDRGGLKPLRRKLAVAHNALNVRVTTIVLKSRRVMSLIRELVTAGVPKHVRVNREREFRQLSRSGESLRTVAVVIGPPRSVAKTNGLRIHAASGDVSAARGREAASWASSADVTLQIAYISRQA